MGRGTALGIFIKGRRKGLGLTQRRLAERAEVAQETVSQIETGRIAESSRGTLERLARALGVPVRTLYEVAGLIETAGCAEAPAPLDATALAEALMDDEASRAWLAAERARRGSDDYRVLCEGIVRVSRGAARVALSVREG